MLESDVRVTQFLGPCYVAGRQTVLLTAGVTNLLASGHVQHREGSGEIYEHWVVGYEVRSGYVSSSVTAMNIGGFEPESRGL
jgi:hypothetical protein